MKHRILGAVILIGFGVVVLPWILGGPEDTSDPPAQAVPQTESATGDDNTKVFVSKITPIGGATPPVLTVTEPKQDQAGTKPAVKPTESKIAKEPQAPRSESVAAKPGEPETAKPATKVAKAAPEVTRGWVVRIGTFSKPDNATRVMATLSKKGFTPKSGKHKTKKGIATRVWVGPYAKRVEAARVRARIERVTGEKGLITPYP